MTNSSNTANTNNFSQNQGHVKKYKNSQAEMTTQDTTGDTFVREDGCICPSKPEPLPKSRKNDVFEACPYDPRFPNTNQTNHCYFSFIDFQRCVRLLGEYPGCKIFYTCYTGLCPNSWIEKWYNQMEEGTFPRFIYPPKPIYRPDPTKMNSIGLEKEDIPPDVC